MLSLSKPSSATQQALLKSVLAALWATGLFYSSGAAADIMTTVPDLQAMLTNFSTAVPSLTRLVTAGAFVMGMYFCIAAIIGMKHFGEMRTMQSREHGMWGPLMELLIGASLLYLPSTIQAGLDTFWQVPTPYAYVTADIGANATFANACFSIIQLIGVIAFIRGLIMLHQASGPQHQPHMLSKALSHLVGGILCINLYNTLQALAGTVGMFF